MANLVSKFTVNGTEIEVKDTVARKGVSTANSAITATNKRIDNVKGAIDTRIDGVEDDIDTIESSAVALTGRVASLENSSRPLCVLAFGDSYLLGSQNTNPDEENWGYYMMSALRLTDGSTYFHYGGSGYGFSKSEGSNISELVQYACINMSSANRAKVTDIVIGAGANDWSESQSTFYNNMENSFHTIKTLISANFPRDVKVHIVAIGWNVIFPRRVNLPSVYRWYARYANARGWIYHECYTLLQNRQYFNPDGVHPTDGAQQALGYSIANFLLGGSMSVPNENLRFNVYLNDTIIGRAYQVGKAVVIQFMRARVANANTPSAITTDQSVGVLNCNLLLGGFSSENNCYFTVPAVFNDQSSTNKVAGEANCWICKTGDEVGRDTVMELYIRTRSPYTQASAPPLNTVQFDGSMVVIPMPLA